jgi:RNA polymerase sigma factor (TIGR02999 family)
MAPGPQDVTSMLVAWSGGDSSMEEPLMEALYDDLRRKAAGILRHGSPGRTLQPTALVNEAYLRLVDQKRVAWQNRAHFLAVAARLMRRILIDYARRQRAAKRGGAATRVTLHDFPAPTASRRSISWRSTRPSPTWPRSTRDRPGSSSCAPSAAWASRRRRRCWASLPPP